MPPIRLKPSLSTRSSSPPRSRSPPPPSSSTASWAPAATGAPSPAASPPSSATALPPMVTPLYYMRVSLLRNKNKMRVSLNLALLVIVLHLWYPINTGESSICPTYSAIWYSSTFAYRAQSCLEG
jgi:hypothetical protein